MSMFLAGDDPRLLDAYHLMTRLAAYDFAARGQLSEANDPIDGVVSGLNMLGEELQDLRQSILSRLDVIATTLGRIAEDPTGAAFQEQTGLIGELVAQIRALFPTQSVAPHP